MIVSFVLILRILLCDYFKHVEWFIDPVGLFRCANDEGGGGWSVEVLATVHLDPLSINHKNPPAVVEYERKGEGH